MMYKDELIQSMLKMSILAFDAVQNKLGLIKFVQMYDNFYYYEALDGHEADEEQKTVLQELSPYVDFHHDVQTKIVDQLYIADGIGDEDIEELGRIGEEKALLKLQKIGELHGLEKLIDALKNEGE